MLTINIDYLLNDLRLHLGDMDATAYRYLDTWLDAALVMSVKTLQRWWNFKYLIDNGDPLNPNLVYRNPNYLLWTSSEPPVIESLDERPIILMAAIIVKEGSLENSAWDIVSWRDNEISFSNLQSGNLRNESLQRDWLELTSLITLPTKRLARPLKGSLPGYRNNDYEHQGDY